MFTYKSIKIIFFIFIFIVLAEFVLFFTIFNKKTTQEYNLLTSDKQSLNNSQESSAELINQNKTINYYASKTHYDDMSLRTLLKGTIDTIDQTPGKYSGFNYNLLFIVTTQTGIQAGTYYSNNDIAKMEVYQKVNDQLSPISLNNLTKGDKIEMETVLDPRKSKDDETISIKIVKLQ